MHSSKYLRKYACILDMLMLPLAAVSVQDLKILNIFVKGGRVKFRDYPGCGSDWGLPLHPNAVGSPSSKPLTRDTLL